MLKTKGLPGWFCGKALSTAVYVLNRCPTKSVDGMTLFEAWHKKKPAVHHLKIFGCIAYVWNTTPHLKKLDNCGRKMIFLGYERSSKAYRAYDPVMKRNHITHDEVFDEQAQWDWSTDSDNGKPDGGNDEFIVEYATINQPTPEADDNDEMQGNTHQRGTRHFWTGPMANQRMAHWMILTMRRVSDFVASTKSWTRPIAQRVCL